MKNVIAGQVAVSVAPTAYRRNLMDLLAASPVITDAEYDTATARILACQDVATLQRWYRNCIREIARREELEPETAQALANMAQGIARFNARLAPVRYATAEQTSEIHKLALHRAITEGERTQALLKLPTTTETQATALIGALWGRIVLRGKKVDSSTVSAC